MENMVAIYKTTTPYKQDLWWNWQLRNLEQPMMDLKATIDKLFYKI